MSENLKKKKVIFCNELVDHTFKGNNNILFSLAPSPPASNIGFPGKTTKTL